MHKLSLCSACLTAAILTDSLGYAAHKKPKTTEAVASPTTCISGTFDSSGDQYYKTVNLLITNNCSTEQDFQNVTITFTTPTDLSTNFWGNFSALSYPDNTLQISSAKQSDKYLATFNLHFPTSYGTTKLAPKGSFQITYGTSNNAVGEAGSVNVYLQSGTSESGVITINNQSAQPKGAAGYAVVHIALNGQTYNDLQVPWSSSASLTGVPPASYTLTPENVIDQSGNVYLATITPSSVTVANKSTATATLTYNQSQQNSQISINMPAVPDAINGYSTQPTVTLTNTSASPASETTVTARWGAATLVKNLNAGTYTFSSPTIVYNGASCTPSFQPSSITTSLGSDVAESTTAVYECSAAKQDTVNISVSGAGTQSTPLKVTLTPLGGDQSSTIVQSIPLTNGAGSATVSLLDGVTYTVVPDTIQGYTATVTPQSLVVSSATTDLTISYADAVASGNPFENTNLFVNQDFVDEVETFFQNNEAYRTKAAKLNLLDDNNKWKISTAIWLDSMQAITGYTDARNTHSMLDYLTQAAAQVTDKPVTITFVVYDLPLRDCNAYSSNGEFTDASDIDNYEKKYIGDPNDTVSPDQTPSTIVATLKRFYDGTISNANKVRIAFIIEPDSLPNLITNANSVEQCRKAQENGTYTTGISYALTQLNAFNTSGHNNIYMYLDIGHSGWLGWQDNMNKFSSIYNNTTLPGFEYARGFISNTANYSPLKEGFTYDAYLNNNAIIQTPFYSWNDVFDETSYIAEIMSLNTNGQLQISNHHISKPSSVLYADKHFLVDTSRNGWLLNTTDYTDATGKTYPRYDQRHHRGNWCNIESVQTKTTSYEKVAVPTIPTSAGLGELPTSVALDIPNPLYSGDSLPIDAFVWIKPPLEADGYYDASNGTGDQMCGSGNGGSHNDSQSTDSLQDGSTHAPHAGFAFDAAFRNLIDVAGCIKKAFTSDFCK